MKVRKSRGQSLVEFALISTVFVLLLVITVDFARAFSAYIMVGNMARAGAQYGSIGNYMGHDSVADAESAMEIAALDEQGSIFGDAATADASIYEDSDGLCVARVEVEYTFQPIFSVGPISGGVPINRSADMRGQILDLCQ